MRLTIGAFVAASVIESAKPVRTKPGDVGRSQVFSRPLAQRSMRLARTSIANAFVMSARACSPQTWPRGLGSAAAAVPQA
jgi:hypothetical protein